MANLNKVIIMGNLTRDPDLRYTPKGTAVCDISLAINETYKGDDGEKKEKTIFVEVTLWGRTAEVAGEYLKKGRKALIEGRLEMDSWEDKESGKKRSKLKVTAENMQLIGSAPTGERQESPARGAKPPVDPDLEPEGDGDSPI